MDEVHDIHARNLRNEDFPATHDLQTPQHEFDALIERDPKAGHPPVGDGHGAIRPLLQEQRNDAAPTRDHIAVAGATEACAMSPGVRVPLYE